jgi:hypothetical protein
VAKAGSDTVDLPSLILDTFDDGACGSDARNGLSGEVYRRVRTGNRGDLA